MVNPVDVQAVVVRAVEAAQNVNQVQNAPLAAQQAGLMTSVQRMERERETVNQARETEGKEVKNSLEGGNRGFYYAGARRGPIPKEEHLVRDDKRGLILDVRL